MYLSSVSSRLILYDANIWDIKKCYGSYDNIIRDISWSDDGKYLLQVNPKGFVEVLSIADNEVRSLQNVPFRDTWSATFHREGHRHVAIGTKSGNVIIWDTKNKSITKSFPSPAQHSSVNFVSYNVKNSNLAATMQNGETIIYSLVSNIPVLTVKLAASKSISAMKFHHESRSLLGLATDEGHLVLRDATTNKDKVFFENVHASPVSDFTFSQINKDVMLSCGYDKIMHVYDIRLQNVVSTVRTSYTLTSIAMNPENQVCLGTKNGFILLYDLRDMMAPLKILKGHNEEVRRLSFQPHRKKNVLTELSLKEDNEVQTPHKHSPVHRRTSDMFLINDSLPKVNAEINVHNDSPADSFLVVMGLDKSNNDTDVEVNVSKYSECESDTIKQNGFEYLQEADKNMSKISTPIGSRITEHFGLPSPICPTTDNERHNIESSNSNTKQGVGDVQCSLGSIDTKTSEELKDFIKLSLSDVADNNKNYFLRIMMAFTKQKLYLEKQLAVMSDQMQCLVQNQNALVETNRKLALEIDKLKMAQQYPL